MPTGTKPAITPYDRLRYNDVRARGSHNSYQRDEDIADQLVYWRLRHIELDIHLPRSEVERQRLNGDWLVYHESAIEKKLNVHRLSDGLALLAGFSRAVPDHEVVTVAVDVKSQFFAPYNTPEKLDALILRFLPGKVYTPGDLFRTVRGASRLQDAAGNWPLLKDVRGKFIFILTTGDLGKKSAQLRMYIEGGAQNRTAFVAPEIGSADDLSLDVNRDAVFFNMTVGVAKTAAPAAFRKKLVSRAYGANDRTSFDNAESYQAHLIGTDAVNTDQAHWSRTHNVHGWPFQGIDVTVAASLVEAGTILQVFARSADIYGKKDGGYFRYNEVSSKPADTVTLTWAVSVASSHVADDNGKAGLMARAGTGDDAANFAVLRVADNGPPRVQVRRKAGDDTQEYKLDTERTPVPGLIGESWMWLRLVLTNGGKTAEGFTSYDAVYWKSLHKETFTQALTLQGIVASSHDTSRDARYYFLPYEGVDRFAAGVRFGGVGKGSVERAFNVPISDP